MTQDLDHIETGLAPIDGVPDWCNDFHTALDDDQHHGEQAAAAHAVGRTYGAVVYWRKKNPAFNAAVIETIERARRRYFSRLSHTGRERALNGWTEETKELNRETNELEIVKTVTRFDPKLLMWMLSRTGGLPELYGEADAHSRGDAPTSFIFKLGDRELTGEIIPTREPPKALEAPDFPAPNE